MLVVSILFAIFGEHPHSIAITAAAARIRIFSEFLPYPITIL